MATPSSPTAHMATLWESIADAIPREAALIHGKRRVTWQEFDARAARLAGAFRRAGLGPGSKIAIDLYNCAEWLEAFYAAIKIRAVPANVNYRYLDQELVHLLTDSDAEAVIFHASLGKRLLALRSQLPRCRLFVQVEDGETVTTISGVENYEDLIAASAPAARIERSPDDNFLLYTGGTTGLPKGVMMSVGRLMGSLAFLGPMLGLSGEELADPVWAAEGRARTGRRLIAIPASPLMHSTGFGMTAVPALVYGGAVVTLTSHSFDAHELLRAIEEHRATLVAIVGDAIGRPVLRALEQQAAAGGRCDLSSLRLISSAGVAWTAETKAGLFKFLDDATLFDACGASEGCTYGFRAYRKGDATSGTRFTPAPGLRFLDEAGNARPAAPGVSGLMANVTAASGYYNDPEKTARNYRLIDRVWYAVPGDYGRIESDGSVTLLGRGSATINTGGEKVHPEEVEDVIKGIAAVDDCIVFGLPDERWGQRVTALVQPARGALITESNVIEHAHSMLAGYKAPKQVLIVERVPRGPNGKPDYQRARQIAADMLGN
jgi:fatty-acyl-CoA synthase